MLKPFEWKDKPALIEHLFPVQKISAESYKEQMAGAGKTLTALGSYWKGRKSLILNKARILGTLLPATEYSLKDLEIFELLMGMDKQSLEFRLKVKIEAGNLKERFPISIFSSKQINELASNPRGLLEVVDRTPEVNRLEWKSRCRRSSDYKFRFYFSFDSVFACREKPA